ncbi:MAG TPA: DUF421 domain-containing protein [Candidatus Tetragenococcus pullicola]|nr:DUF421 domain-containing protein [Candidatus Tetragenococcus pullicola]
MQIYYPVIIKFVVGIIFFVIQINISGKGNLAPSSPMDAIQNYVLGGIIGGIIYNQEISVLQFILVLIIWTFLVILVKFLREHNRFVKIAIDGRPITLIKNGNVNVEECLRVGMSANELMFKLRSSNIYELKKVKRAVLEQNGQLTIIEFGDENIRYPIIVDGLANIDVLEMIHKEENWLLEQVQEKGFDSITDIYLGEYVMGELRLNGYQSEKK